MNKLLTSRAKHRFSWQTYGYMRTYVHILRIHNLCHPRTNPPFCHNLWATNICITIFMHIIQFLIYLNIHYYIYTHLCIYHGYMTRIMGIRIKIRILRVMNIISKSSLYIYPSYVINIIIHGYYIRYILASTHTYLYTYIYILYIYGLDWQTEFIVAMPQRPSLLWAWRKNTYYLIYRVHWYTFSYISL
jgi:hypothetical protein